MYHSFEELEVWKLACQVSVRLYELLKSSREYSLRNQMQRASVSIASNIAEGAERGGMDFVRFLKIARGSAAELRTQTYIAGKVQMIDAETTISLVSDLKRISKMLTRLAESVKTSAVLTENRKPKTEND